jgi:hypothetical protein
MTVFTYSKRPTRNRRAYKALYECTAEVQIVAMPQPTSSDGITQRGDTRVRSKLEGI